MKIIALWILILVSLSQTAFSQVDSIYKILKKSSTAISNIKVIQYDIKTSMKYFADSDTIVEFGICLLQPIQNDPIGFKLIIESKAHHISYLYNGNVIIMNNNSDSTATILDSRKYGTWAITGNWINQLIFLPLSNISKLTENRDSFKLKSAWILKQDTDKYRNCIGINLAFEDFREIKNMNRIYYIDKTTWLPLKYILEVDADNMHQFLKQEILNFSLNQETQLGKICADSFIPSFYSVKRSLPDSNISLMKKRIGGFKNKIAPTWELTGIDGKKYKSDSLNSKIVLLDFWYVGCFPCLKSIPILEKIYEKYKNDGLIVLGANIRDTNQVNLRKFADQRKITYPILINASEVSKIFNVTSYPTLFFIDKNGIIREIEIGFNSNLENTIEKIIKE